MRGKEREEASLNDQLDGNLAWAGEAMHLAGQYVAIIIVVVVVVVVVVAVVVVERETEI